MQAKSNRPDPLVVQSVWFSPEITSPEFLAITAEAVYWLDECTTEKAAELSRRLNSEERPTDVMPPETQVFVLAKLISVTLDRNEESLSFDYWKDADALESLEVTARDRGTRDRLFEQISRHLGEAWRATEIKYTRMGAIRTPLFRMLGVGAITALF